MLSYVPVRPHRYWKSTPLSIFSRLVLSLLSSAAAAAIALAHASIFALVLSPVVLVFPVVAAVRIVVVVISVVVVVPVVVVDDHVFLPVCGYGLFTFSRT